MENIEHVAKFLEKGRDELFRISGILMSSDDADFSKAGACFDLAKRIELVRRDLLIIFTNDSESREVETSATRSAKENSRKATLSKSRRKKDYPRYEFRGGNLTKVGLSRDGRTEYEHTVDSTNLQRIVNRINELPRGKEFTIPDILQDLSDLPDYQVYVVIALFRERGFLQAVRKGVYQIGGEAPSVFSVGDLEREI